MPHANTSLLKPLPVLITTRFYAYALYVCSFDTESLCGRTLPYVRCNLLNITVGSFVHLKCRGHRFDGMALEPDSALAFARAYGAHVLSSLLVLLA